VKLSALINFILIYERLGGFCKFAFKYMIMKVLLDIPNNKLSALMELLKPAGYVKKAEAISAPDAELFSEIKEIKQAFKNVELIKAGTLKTRPASELLNEL